MSAEEAVKNETMDTETGENAAAQDEDERKLFVGGLPQDAKDPEIREYLCKCESEFKQFKDVVIDEVTKLRVRTQLHEAEKKYESTNDELNKKVEE